MTRIRFVVALVAAVLSLTPAPVAAQRAAFFGISVNGAAINAGTGSPEGARTGNPGDLYIQKNGGSGSILWQKATGSGTNTGWEVSSLFIHEALTGGYPPGSVNEWVLKASNSGAGVLAVRNTSTTGFSAYTSRTADGHEVLAMGYGNPGLGGTFFRDQNYIQSWSGVDTAADPKRLFISMDGNYGSIGSGVRFYQRQSFEPAGDIKFWQLIPWNTTQKELLHLDATNNRVLIGYNGGNVPERQLHVVGPSGGGNLLLDAFAANGAQILHRHAGGALGALSQTGSGQAIINIIGEGYTSSAAYTNPIVGINGVTTEALTSTAQGTRLDFRTTPIGSATIATTMQHLGDGSLLLNSTTAPPFKWDGTAKRLQLSGDGQTLDAVATNEKPALHIGRDFDGVAGAGAIYVDTYGAQPNITMRRANGTQASKTALADQDIIFNFRSYGYNATDGYALGGLVRMVQNGTNTTSNHGQDFLVALTANGSTSAPSERFRIRSDGALWAVPEINTPQNISSTGTVNALAVTSSLVFLNNTTDLTINGIAAGVNGQEVVFVSRGAGNVFFAYQSGSAAAGDKLNNFVTSGLTPLAAGKGRATYRYDSSSALWQLVDHEQGDFLTFAFSAGDFSANGSMTWTVASGDVGSDLYMIRGRSMIWSFRVNTTTVGGTPNTQLIMTLPGYNIRAGNYMHIIFANDNGTEMTARMVNVSTNTFSIVKIGGANWTASTDNTIINATLTLGVS